MKSQEHVLLSVEAGLLKDVLLAYPQIEGVDKDLVRITSLVKNRGLGCFTLDLPNLDALLLKGLEKGRLILEGPCSTARSKRIQVPRLLSGLWLRVFDRFGVLREDVDVTAIAFLRQIFCLGKRIVVPCTPNRVEAAMEEYHGIEKELRRPSESWDEDSLNPGSHNSAVSFMDGLCADNTFFSQPNGRGEEYGVRRLLRNLEHVCSRFCSEIGTPDFVQLSSNRERDEERGTVRGLRHGPGAVSDLRRTDDKSEFPNWPDKLQHYFPFDEFGVFNLNHFQERSYPSHHEPPSKLCQVPKTAKTPRLIAAEPTCYQWTQQLVSRFLISKLDEVFKGDFVTIKDQLPSRRMAVVASMDRSLTTVDLSSASDRLSCWAVERIFRGNRYFLEILHAVRTRWTFDGISREKNFLKIKKFATQGSALTFPVQSTVFLMCALAVLPRERTLEDYRLKWRQQVRVFGDDIIIPSDRYADLVRLLHYLGLKVNMEKSFHTGFFRESCGKDAYKGYDVTPCKPLSVRSDTPTAWSALIDLSNNLFLKGYWHAAKALESTLSARILRSLPTVGPRVGLQGRISFSANSEANHHLRFRWNAALCRREVLVFGLRSKAKRKSTGGYGKMYQFMSRGQTLLSDTPVLANLPRLARDGDILLEPKHREVLRWVPVEDLSVTDPLLTEESRRDRIRHFT